MTAFQYPEGSKRALMARLGRLIYPWRGALGIPLMVAVLMLGRPQPDSTEAFGLLRGVLGWDVLLFGLFVRIWGVACWFTPDREGVIGGKRLMTEDGPYPYTRNPRYLGNFCMGFGASIIAGVPWIPLIYIAVWCGVHVPIVIAEAETLSRRFGLTYQSYCRRVPALIPRLDPAFPIVPQTLFVNWRGGIREEIGTVSGWVSIGLFLHFWRGAHFYGWGHVGAHWLYIPMIVMVVIGCERIRRALPLETVDDPSDRPIRP